MGIGTLIDGVTRQVELISDGLSETLFEPVIRLGVTGLSRAGKTVFITSLVANLLDRGRMPALQAASQGRIEAAFLQPQPDDLVPRFEYEKHLSAMTGPNPHWPESTRAISQLRLSLRVAPAGVLSTIKSARTIHIDIVDYPGEWLLDLPLMEQSFEQWSQGAIALAQKPSRAPFAAEWLALLEQVDPEVELDEPQAQKLAAAFTAYLQAARESGLSACAPGRFLMPGDLAGSPALTFAPLPTGKYPRNSLGRAFARRYETYKSGIVRPFFRDHFSRIDRQVVLVDALGAIHAGPQAVGDLRDALADILSCFKTGRNGFLSALRGKSVERILFAATKADHLHHHQHPALTTIMGALVRSARDKATYQGAQTDAMALASLRATVEETRSHDGETLDLVRGRLLSTGKQAAMYPGRLPEDPAVLLKPAEQGAERWLDGDYAIMGFAPAEVSLKAGDGPPHIRLDRAAEFLIGDRLI
ncbi:YcjX family protein [Neptunicoccus sediminis]|uniref:YcjX family protein n=1 Tax=Neptunicoccus sediminis TaxID=1892596 RepID=UPI00084608CD|nr:YcjX family protein [Neptunicoccus sediminis]